jgi:hypothetical protein
MLLFLGLCLYGTTEASAQISEIWKRAGVGLSVGLFKPLDSDVDAGAAFGFNFGLSPQEGWGLTGGFSWYGADLFATDLLRDRKVAEVRIRPLMAGVGYTWKRGRVATSASVVAGVSFNSGNADALRDAVRESVSLDVGNSFAWRPQIKVEFAVVPKLGVAAASGFLFTYPKVTLTTPRARITDRWNANSFYLFGGFTFYPFR